MNSLIYELLDTGELFSACEKLKEIDIFLSENTTARSSFCKSLCKEMRERALRLTCIYSENKPYAIFATRFSIPAYLTTFGFETGRVRDTMANIKATIASIGDGALVPSGNCLTPESAKNVLEVMAGKLPYFEAIAKQGLLRVLLLENSHKIYNSLCGVNAEGTRATVLMYHMKNHAVSPEYVFLHELGHVLHIALCGPDEVPEEFYSFQSSFSNPLPHGEPIAKEVFADTFAIAVMHGTALQKYMPFKLDSDIIGDMIERFFKQLLKNYSGQAS